jgi:hypothetical protein
MSKYFCRCGEDIDHRRYKLGFRACLSCGEVKARRVRHTVAPLHKSAYFLVSRADLKGLNKYNNGEMA